jgi:hypothetical protein
MDQFDSTDAYSPFDPFGTVEPQSPLLALQTWREEPNAANFKKVILAVIDDGALDADALKLQFPNHADLFSAARLRAGKGHMPNDRAQIAIMAYITCHLLNNDRGMRRELGMPFTTSATQLTDNTPSSPLDEYDQAGVERGVRDWRRTARVHPLRRLG